MTSTVTSRGPGDRPYADNLASALYTSHASELLAYVRQLSGDRHRGEDFVQETLLRAWLHAEKLIDDGGIRAWLFRVAHNIVVDDLRARGRRPAEVFDESAFGAIGVSDPTERLVTEIDMDDALSSLTPKHRRVLVEVYYYGRTVNETADLLSIPHGTAKSRVRHGLRDLRRRLRA